MNVKDFFSRLMDKICCQHEWVLFKEVTVDNTGPEYNGSLYQVWHFYYKKCGKFKKIKSH